MSQKILGFSGKLASGKSTSCNFLVGQSLLGLGLVRGSFFIDEQGKLVISDLFGDTKFEGYFDITRQNREFLEFAKDYLFDFVRIYSCADLLKREVGMKILGLKYEQVYGNQEAKSELTHIQWKNLPFVVVDDDNVFKVTAKKILEDSKILIISFKQGEKYLTVREILQYIGTDVFRQMYEQVWVDGLLRQIEEDRTELALVCDVRFPNEVEGIQKVGGKIIRLTRYVANGFENHKSERALDEDNFDWSKFDAVIDNQEMTIGQQNEAVRQLLIGWGWNQQEMAV